MLTLKGIIKAYHDTVILDIPELQLQHHIYWLLGGNGAGKTTSMKVMAGLIPFKGDILVDNNISCREQPVQYRRLVNYAEAEPLYPGFLTGNDLVSLFVQTKGNGYKDIKELTAMLGVDRFIHKPVSTYSSGMLKKLSLLLAFTGRPKVILLDEPLITLDNHAVPLLYNMVEEFYTHYGVTFCITSHQQVSAAAIQLQVQDRNIVKL
ncbi:ABC-2 type transport system ATP-binding protein [Chitinophaga sp. CF118]|uniref:ABC transporter ATP-binding protein n=1 Tax=Chitinophaga sp. CF118 TaxID=1884367 RepID=UPI0008EF0809|nr:ATP-binding cassette domain-containing protein [Chitinophaga sp. CF118]SFE11919.1 ABC-2 type transport system ATP-binding protein [Chitinophaga sp. CF118]